MVLPTNTDKSVTRAAASSQSCDQEAEADAHVQAPSPNLNIQNDATNYHWFLPEIAGSRTSISTSGIRNSRIRADMGLNRIVDHILSHVST